MEHPDLTGAPTPVFRTFSGYPTYISENQQYMKIFYYFWVSQIFHYVYPRKEKSLRKC